MTDLWQFAFVLLTVLVVGEVVAIMALARAIGLLQLRIAPPQPALLTPDGLRIGSPTPEIRGFDLRIGRHVTLTPRIGRWALVFVTPTCSTCRDLARDLAMTKGGRTINATCVLVARGPRAQSEVFVGLASDLMVLSDADGSIHQQFQVDIAPFAFTASEGRITGKGIVNSRSQLELLIEGVSTTLDARTTDPHLTTHPREPELAGVALRKDGA